MASTITGVTVASTTSVTINYTAYTGGLTFTRYGAQYSTDGGTTWLPATPTIVTANTSTLILTYTGLTTGTTYKFRVSAMNVNTIVSSSAASSDVLVATVPAQVVTWTLAQKASTVGTLTISAVTAPAANGSAITGYNVQTSLDNISWSSATLYAVASTYDISGLANSTLYYVKMAAVNSIGTGTYSTSKSATTCGVPVQVTAYTLAQKASTVGTLTISAITPTYNVASNGATVTGYYVQTAPQDNSGNWSSAIGPFAAASFDISGLADGTLYYTRVAAVNIVGTGTYSTITKTATTCGVPSQVAAYTVAQKANTVGTLTISAITAPATNGATITGYYVQTSTDNISWSSALGPFASTYDISGLANGTLYYTRVAAANIVGTGAYSTITKTATTCGVPGQVTAYTVGQKANTVGTLTISAITAPATNGATITGYYVQTAPQDNSGNWSSALGPFVSPYDISGLANGTLYYTRVAAVNIVGTGAYSTITNTATTCGVPAAPTIGTITPGNLQLSVAFTAGATNGATITNYEYSTDSGTNWTVRTPSNSTSPLVITGLTNGVTYPIRLRAVNVVGSGTASSVVSATPRTVPDQVGTVTPTPGSTSISLTWSAPYNGGSSITGYKIERSTDLSGWTTVVASTTTIPYSVILLTSGSPYYFRVSAINVAGTGAASNTVSTGTLTTTPTVVSASKASNTSIAISFTPPTTNGLSIMSYTVTPYISGVAQTPLTGYTSSPITISSLSPAILYTYTVAAVTSIGTGTASAQTSGIVLPVVASVPSDVSYNYPPANTTTATYANATLIYTGLAYSQAPVVSQKSSSVWTVAYGGFTDTLTNVKAVVFTDISGLFVDVSFGTGTPASANTVGTLVSSAAAAARSVGSGGDIIFVGAGTFRETALVTINKAVTIVGSGSSASIYQNATQGVWLLGLTCHNITLKNMTFDSSLFTTTDASYALLVYYYFGGVPPGDPPVDASGNERYIKNFVCDSCIFTNPLTKGIDPSGNSYANKRGVALTRVQDGIIQNCTFPKTFNFGLSVSSPHGLTITNSTFYACNYGIIGIFPSNVQGLEYTTYGVDISDPSNNFIDVSSGKYFYNQVAITPTSIILIQPYANYPTTPLYPISYGITGSPNVLLPNSMNYVYINNPTVSPYSSDTSFIVAKRYTSDQVYLESYINTYSWYGYQFSTGKHLIENRFNPIPLLNNLLTATPGYSTILNPHVIEFQLQSDVLLLTDVSMSAVTYNQVVVISDDVSGTYIYNSNVATTLGTSYTNNLYIIPNTVPRDLSSNPYPGVNPSALVSVTTASGGAYTYSSDYYKYRLSTVQQSYLPAVRGTTWYANSDTNRLSLLTGPEKVPFAPTVDLSSGDHFLNVTWTDNPGAAPTTTFLSDISSNLEHYTHTDYTSGYNTFQVINNGTTFFVTVTASNEFGSATSAPQTILVATVPDAPTEGATDVSSNSLTVYWSPNYDGGSPILSYNIYWYDASTNLLVGSAHNVSASPYTITGLTRGKSYDWAVSATNAFGEGAQSSQGPSYSPSVPPDPPTNVVGTRLDMGVSVTWDPPADSGGSPILYYNVYDASTNVLDISSTSNSTNITGLTNGRPYSFYVKAVNSRGASTASVPSSPVTPAGYPLTSVTGLAVASVGDGTVTLTFDPAPAIVNGAPFVSYNIFQSTDNSYFTLSTVSDTYTVTGLTNGVSYWFKVSIINDVGEGPQSTSVGPARPPILVTLFLTDLTKTYNGVAQTPTVYSVPTGVTNADVSFNPAGVTVVGSYVVTATLTNSLYSGADVSGTFVITQAPLTVTGVTASNKSYDGTTAATLSAATLSGTIYGADDVSLNSTDASGHFVTVDVSTGIVVVVSGYRLSDSNYQITNQPLYLSANITPAPLTVTGVTAANKVYDGTTSATISGGDLSGTIYNPDVVNLITTDASGHFVTANAGTGKTVVVVGFRLNSTNYQITNQPFDISANITPAPATIDVSGLSFTYDTTAHSPTTVTTTPRDLSYNITYAASNVNVGTGSCGFTVSITNPNYSGFFVGALTIAPATLTITDVSANNKPYDGTRVATLTGGTLNGVYPADSVGIVRGTGTFAQANVGTGIAVTASDFDLSGVQFNNYQLAAQPSVTSANITQALAGIDVSGLTVTYTG